MKRLVLFIAILILGITYGASCGDFADTIISYSNLGGIPYDDPNSVLGKPATIIKDFGFPPTPPGNYFVSMVYPAYNRDINNNKVIVTIKQQGHITVKFNEPIYNHPDNWYGKDFIVFGNSFFTANGYVYPNSNMEVLEINNGIDGYWEEMTVSVSQDGVTWYDFTNGPYADDYCPTNPHSWDWINRNWGVELDFTKPVDPSLTKSSFGYQSVASAINLLKDSAGGTAFDIDIFDLPLDPNNGLKWIQYIKVTADRIDDEEFYYEGEIDAFARVGKTINPIKISDAKKLPDGSRVILNDCLVTTGAYETGLHNYVQNEDRSCGIRVLQSKLTRNDKVILYGVIGTLDNEKVLYATSYEVVSQDENIKPLGMPNKSIGGSNFYYDSVLSTGQIGIAGSAGLNNIGLLIRTTGKVISVDSNGEYFIIDDGSGRNIKCKAPRDPEDAESVLVDFVMPSVNQYIVVTGISSIEYNQDIQANVSIVLLRDNDDLQVVN
ncbi:MAG: hypothetical protein SNJ70_02655 [Armatimonadota bacterium]